MNPLREKIEAEIRNRGPMPFSRYMELCLYDPELGYYSRNAEQFGKTGDFYTSSDVHAVFGRLLARQFEEMWRAASSPKQIFVVEFGPGRGLFAQDVLDWSKKKFPDLFQAMRYMLVESSPALRQRIEVTVADHLESGKAEFARWNDLEDATNTPATKRREIEPSLEDVLQQTPTIVFANEFFDALPVEIISQRGALRIDLRDNHLVETWVSPNPEELEYLDRYSVHPELGERLEAPLIAQRYMNQIAKSISQGFFIAIDYGYAREEQLAGRHRGTLKAIRQHSISASPYEAPGEQDITADVNFTALATVAKQNGMHSQKLITQSQFLMGIGEATQFADAFEDCRLPQERAKRALQLKHLVTPAGMGESFHVLVAGKGMDSQIVRSLAGLSFGQAH